jgi:hypothetical protein
LLLVLLIVTVLSGAELFFDSKPYSPPTPLNPDQFVPSAFLAV